MTEDPGYRNADSLRTMDIDQVVVTGARTIGTTNNLPMSVSVVTGQQMDGRLEQSVLPLLVERVPSLMITSRSVMGYGSSTGGAGAMTMRGVGGGMLVLIDGHPQFMGIFSHPLADTYEMLMAERVEVVRGPAAVLYGQNSLAGVINILTRRQREDGVDTRIRTMYGSYNTLSAEAVNQIRFGKFNSVASFTYNRSDGHRKNMDFEQYSGYAKVGYDFSAHWKSFVDLNISQTNSSNPGRVDAPAIDNDMDILRGITSFSLTNTYNRTSGALKFYYNFGDHYIDDGYRAGGEPRQSRFNSTDRMLGITIFQNYSLWRGNQTTLGFDFQRYGGRAWTSYLNGDADREISKEYMNDFAAHVNFQQLLWGKLTVNTGVRLDHHSVTGDQWIPQLGLSWQAGANTTLKGIVSKGYRNPTMRELYMWGPKNPNLKPESLMNYEVSVSQHFFGRRLALELNLYYIKGKNSIILAPVNNEEGTTTNRYINTGKLENYGLEFTGSYRANRNLELNANYSYLHMEHKTAYAPKHKAYAGADYRLKKWSFATGLQYVGELVTQALDPTDAAVELEKDSFLLWNMRVSYNAAKWLDLFVRGENLLDSGYETYKGYPMPGATVMGGVALKF
ncbi:TonB-dependent receptor [uncultured Alistipes sp.]|uniref:TonB-dependent receptor n=1 Tax=uncultured Alistipes sp. TaxID=538949 RepID=UPI0025E9C0A6|nr:TonB-dependent receptor [uncultured Alistipes sp.]